MILKPAAIFDMDGVLIVNMQFHEQAFTEFGKRHGKIIDRTFFLQHISGSTNERIMPKIFGNISDSEIKRFAEEKEEIYRSLYAPHLRLSNGLSSYLNYLKDMNVPMAIASNAPPANVDFIIEKLQLKEYFTVALNSFSVINPKPAPDMFLKAAELLGANPESCIVFEDAPGGIRAAYKAGMTAVCILSTHKKEEFEKADLFLEDFTSKELLTFTNQLLKGTHA